MTDAVIDALNKALGGTTVKQGPDKLPIFETVTYRRLTAEEMAAMGFTKEGTAHE